MEKLNANRLYQALFRGALRSAGVMLRPFFRTEADVVCKDIGVICKNVDRERCPTSTMCLSDTLFSGSKEEQLPAELNPTKVSMPASLANQIQAQPTARNATSKPMQQSSSTTIDRTSFNFAANFGPPTPGYDCSTNRLSLDVLSKIIGYLNSPAVAAWVSRILHYLAISFLYTEVRLRGRSPTNSSGARREEKVHGRKRKRDEIDGDDYDFESSRNNETVTSSGGGQHAKRTGLSLFLVGLATLQRPTVCQVVKRLVLEGELETGNFAINKASKQLSGQGVMACLAGPWFSWELENAYIHPMLWYSFARHLKLHTFIYVRPPSCLQPSHVPTTFAAAFQNLTSLSVLDIDGDNSPDDFSRSVFGDLRKLRKLRLSWVDNESFQGRWLVYVFGARVKSLTALSPAGASVPNIKKLKLRKLKLMNLYIAPGDLAFEFFTIPSPVVETSRGSAASPGTSITPNSRLNPKTQPASPMPNLKTLRTESFSPHMYHLLSVTRDLRNLYLLDGPSYPLRPIPRYSRTISRRYLPESYL
ncbi:hypothetical protein BDZ91DRAFT_795055 [Kalaharituber pfeilii]|nr:hypothetical protein BDZ91DRAFT_795055 [Kalaharituber pfeilii]